MSIPLKIGMAGVVVTATVLIAPAAGETVNVHLTTTSDSGGRTVMRGLQQQTRVAFVNGTGGSANQTFTVNENTTCQ